MAIATENTIPQLSGDFTIAQGVSSETVPAGEVWEVVTADAGNDAGMFYVEGDSVSAHVVKMHKIRVRNHI